jgi:hypothetical protein
MRKEFAMQDLLTSQNRALIREAWLAVRDNLGEGADEAHLANYDSQLPELAADESCLGSLTRQESLFVAAELRRQERERWLRSMSRWLARAAHESGVPIHEPDESSGLTLMLRDCESQRLLLLRALSSSVSARLGGNDFLHVRRGYRLAVPMVQPAVAEARDD